MIINLPFITHDEYEELTYFYERDNPVINCSSVLQWYWTTPSYTNFNSSCIDKIHFTTTNNPALYAYSSQKKEVTDIATITPVSYAYSSDEKETVADSTIVRQTIFSHAQDSDITTNPCDHDGGNTVKTPTAPNSTPTKVTSTTNESVITPPPSMNALATTSAVMIVITLGSVLVIGGVMGAIKIRKYICLKQGVKRNRSDYFYPPIYINPTYSATINHLEDESVELENV